MPERTGLGKGVDVQLEPQQCRILVMIADTGSISSAARALGVGQDKLALQLAQIEVLCGFRVFERDARGARVTEPGRTALRSARAACQPRSGAPQAREPRAVRLAGSPGILDQLLPDLVHHLGDTRWTATTGSDADVVHGLRNGHFDLALLVRWPHVAYLPREGLVRRQVGEAPLRALLPAGAHTPVALQELADRPWVVRADPDARSAVLAECARRGSPPRSASWWTSPPPSPRWPSEGRRWPSSRCSPRLRASPPCRTRARGRSGSSCCTCGSGATRPDGFPTSSTPSPTP